MVPCGDEQDGGAVGADTEEGEQAGAPGGHEGHDELVEAVYLVAEELASPAKLS
jgi:hypothetical protein